MKILIAEDDADVLGILRDGLALEHHELGYVLDGRMAQSFALDPRWEMMILDLNLPLLNGFDVLKELRRSRADLPVLVVTGRDSVEDRVRGLDLGADDYLVKPFSISELLARIRAIQRRVVTALESVLRVEDLELRRVKRQVARGGRKIDLTPKEFALLEYLMLHPARPVSRTLLFENVWGLSFDSLTNVVDVYVYYLRRKVDDGHSRKLIHTVRGVGYQIGGEDPEAALSGEAPRLAAEQHPDLEAAHR
jgi:DNA-binding response OmpR family regulator